MTSTALAERTAHKDPFCMKQVLRKQSVHEGEHFVALYNSKALTDGHSLIITRRHILGLLDLQPAEVKELFDMISTVLPVILDTYNNGERTYDLKIRSGEFSGRTVNHFHVHLIPRRKVSAAGGGTEYERIYAKNLQNVDRPFLDDIENDLAMLRCGLQNPKQAPRSMPVARKEIDAALSANIFYESSHFVAMYHPKPVIRGQALLVPKRDVSDFMELDDEERMDFAITYSKIMNLLLKVYGDESRSYITSMQTGEYEGRPIDRLHVNLIPRSRNDRYSGRDDEMYLDIYERGNMPPVLDADQIKAETEVLRQALKK